MSLSSQRATAVAATLQRIRQIEKEQGISRASLQTITSVLQELAEVVHRVAEVARRRLEFVRDRQPAGLVPADGAFDDPGEDGRAGGRVVLERRLEREVVLVLRDDAGKRDADEAPPES